MQLFKCPYVYHFVRITPYSPSKSTHSALLARTHGFGYNHLSNRLKALPAHHGDDRNRDLNTHLCACMCACVHVCVVHNYYAKYRRRPNWQHPRNNSAYVMGRQYAQWGLVAADRRPRRETRGRCFWAIIYAVVNAINYFFKWSCINFSQTMNVYVCARVCVNLF